MFEAKTFLSEYMVDPPPTADGLDPLFVGVVERQGQSLCAYLPPPADLPSDVGRFVPVCRANRELFWQTVKASRLTVFEGYNRSIAGLLDYAGRTTVVYDKDKFTEELRNSFDDSDRSVPKVLRLQDMYDRLRARDLGDSSPWFLDIVQPQIVEEWKFNLDREISCNQKPLTKDGHEVLSQVNQTKQT